MPMLVVEVSNETLPAPPPNMSPPPPPPDFKAPVLTLIGSEEVDVRQYHEYVDGGATCMDNVDGGIVVLPPHGLSEVNTTIPTLPNLPHELTYECFDQAGNRAEIRRRVYILDSRCADASERTGFREYICPGIYVSDELKTECSVYGVCSEGSGYTNPDAQLASLPAASTPVDSIPPRIFLVSIKQGSTMARTAEGVLVLREEVVQGQKYTDPGYVCLDQNEGDITSSVSIFGVSTLDTKRATTDPFVIRYTCMDLAGVQAEEVQRWVTVISLCDGEVACDDGSCPVDGYCVANSGIETSILSEISDAKPDEPPSIQLVGSEVVEITGGGYAKCFEGLPVLALCDGGAVAHDSIDGDLTPYVKACGRNFRKEGLAGCAISGADYPGSFEVTFSVTDSNGRTATVIRTVKVLVECDAGEERCRDGITCVPEGKPCEPDIAIEVDEAAEPLQPPPPPNVTLVGLHVAKVPRFTAYRECMHGQAPTIELPCDMGATAHDAIDGNISAALLICPPESCMPFGCHGHELWRKGINSCVNTSAPVGTVFEVDFVVFNTNGLHSSATRTITIDERCASGQYWCPANSPTGRCESTTCETVEALVDDGLPSAIVTDVEEGADAGPKIKWRTPPAKEMPFGFIYGQTPWRMSGVLSAASPIAACYNELRDYDFPFCAATAQDAIDGDVTATLRATVGSSEASSACTPAVLRSGLCPPGTYHFHMSAYDRDGNIGFGSSALIIEIVQGWEESYRLNVGGEGCESLLDPTSEDSAFVRTRVASAINVKTGRVRIERCENDPRLARTSENPQVLEVKVVRSFDDKGPPRDSIYGRRRAQEVEDVNDNESSNLEYVNSGLASADPQGSWAKSVRLRSITLASNDLAVRIGNLTIETNLTALHEGDAAKTDGASGTSAMLRASFEENTNEMSLRHGEIALSADELFELTKQFTDEAMGMTMLSAALLNSTAKAQQREDELQEIVEKASAAISEANGYDPNVGNDCRGAHGSRNSYYTVVATSATREEGQTEVVTKAPSTDGGSPPSPTRRRGASVRRALRDDIQQRTAFPGQVLDGYDFSPESSSDASARYIPHDGYIKPRTLGSQGNVRIIGGVLVTQRRAAQEAGCKDRDSTGVGRDSSRNVRSGRFNHLYSDDSCSTTPEGFAFGYDPMFARLDMPPGINDPARGAYPAGLYNPALRSDVSAYYNSTEFVVPGVPYAFFSRDYEECRNVACTPSIKDVERALFDVYLDGTLMEARARLLITYLYLARFMNRRTSSVNFRVLLHNEASESILDVRVSMQVDAQGQLSSSSHVWSLPIVNYFDGTEGRAALFATELVLFCIALVLFVNFAYAAIKYVQHIYHSIEKREMHRSVVRTHWMDILGAISAAIKVAIPLSLLVACLVRFVYYFYYVESFTYQSSYRWYDGDGSSEARILLVKRTGAPQPQLEGYPRGAFRHMLPTDLSERDAYMNLLDKVDTMHNLYGAYMGLQAPIFLGIISNIARLFMGIPGLIPYFRTMLRALPPMILVMVVLLGFALLCSYALYLMIGDRFEPFSRVDSAVRVFAEYQMGDMSAVLYRTMLGIPQGKLSLPSEQGVAAMVYLFYPLVCVFMLMQFAMAIVLEVFIEEKQRGSETRRVQRKFRTREESLARMALRRSNTWHGMRDRISAFFYSIGWPNVSAYIFTRNAKWLNPARQYRGYAKRLDMLYELNDEEIFKKSAEKETPVLQGIRDFIVKVNPSAAALMDTYLQIDPSFGTDESVVHPLAEQQFMSGAQRWRRAKLYLHANHQAAMTLRSIIKNMSEVSFAGKDKKGSLVNPRKGEELPELTNYTSGGNMRTDGLITDTARYVRMNQSSRREVVVPILGTLGPAALGEVLHMLHDMIIPDVANADTEERDVEMEGFAWTFDTHVRSNTLTTPRKTNTEKFDRMLFEFAPHVDQERLRHMTLHLQESERHRILRSTCVRLANRLVFDLGWRPGTEVGRLHGKELASAVLRRAHNNSKGMAAASADMYVLSASLRSSVTALSNDVNMSRNSEDHRRKLLARRFKTFKKDVINGVLHTTRKPAAAATEVPWRVAGVLVKAMGMDDPDDDSKDVEGLSSGGRALHRLWSSNENDNRADAPRTNTQRRRDVLLRGGE